MLLINADLSVAWCEPELAEFFGNLPIGSLLIESKHPVVQDIQQLLAPKPDLQSPQVYPSKSQALKIIIAAWEPAGYLVSVLPLRFNQMIQSIDPRFAIDQELQIQLQNYRESQARQDLFMRTLAHDIRSPLATLHMLLMQANKEQIMPRSRYFSILEENVYQLEALVDGLLELIEMQKDHSFSANKIDFSELLERVQRQLNYALQASGGKIEAQFEQETICYVPTWLESILRNLISNSIKYAAPDRPPLIEIKTQKLLDDQVLLHISDNGRGFKNSVVPAELFQPLMRFHHEVPGSGLGLSLVKSMVEKNGGQIQVTSTSPLGTVFELKLVPYTDSKTF